MSPAPVATIVGIPTPASGSFGDGVGVFVSRGAGVWVDCAIVADDGLGEGEDWDPWLGDGDGAVLAAVDGEGDTEGDGLGLASADGLGDGDTEGLGDTPGCSILNVKAVQAVISCSTCAPGLLSGAAGEMDSSCV